MTVPTLPTPPAPPAPPPSTSPIYHHGLIYQPDCALCPLQGQRIVPPDGPIPARVVFVGEDPGRNEVIQGRGFVGASGQLLWFLAQRAGIHVREHEVWTTNAALCRTPDKGIKLASGFRLSRPEAKTRATQACRRRLLWEIKYVTQDNPLAVVVPLGNYALWAVTGYGAPRVYAYRGSVNEVDLDRLIERIGTEDIRPSHLESTKKGG